MNYAAIISMVGQALPLIIQTVQMGSQVAEAVKTKKPVVGMVDQLGPGFLDLLKSFGSATWPNLKPEHQIQAAAQATFDQASIKFAQDACNKLVNAQLTVDGIMGPKTKAAVEAFQTNHGVSPADGWPGPDTQAAMQLELNKQNK